MICGSCCRDTTRTKTFLSMSCPTIVPWFEVIFIFIRPKNLSEEKDEDDIWFMLQLCNTNPSSLRGALHATPNLTAHQLHVHGIYGTQGKYTEYTEYTAHTEWFSLKPEKVKIEEACFLCRNFLLLEL